MSLFTPCTSLLGGSILGASASLLLLVNGDILGCSGILRDAAFMPFSLSSTKTSNSSGNATTKHYWKVVFVASFVMATRLLLMALNVGSDGVGSLGLTVLSTSSDSSAVSSLHLMQHGVSGLLVGYGTSLSNGCTSGHGVCGLARYSIRSLVAVLSFLTTGMITATTMGSMAMQQPSLPPGKAELGWMVTLLSVVGAVAANVTAARSARHPVTGGADTMAAPTSLGGAFVATVVSGASFAIGLALSGMTQTAKVLGFLDLSPLISSTSTNSYDPTLLLVLGSAVTVSWLSYQYIDLQKRRPASSTAPPPKPLCGTAYNIPSSIIIDASLILGAVCFGLGWGLTGLCPGPALFAAAAGVVPVVTAWWPTFLIGSYCALQTKEYLQKNGANKTI